MIFQAVRQVPTVEIVNRYLPSVDLRRRGSRHMGRCPFHDDRTPSFVVFPGGGWHCFGCQANGDQVSFVARVLNLRPIEAARVIARDFNLHIDDGKPLSLEAKRRVKEAARERELLQSFKEWRNKTLQGVAVLSRACERLLAKGPEDPYYGTACNIETQIIYLLELLNGPIEDQVDLFKEHGWRWAV